MIFLTLNILNIKGGIETFNQYFIQALKQNNCRYVSISLHDKINQTETFHYACSGNYVKFLFKILFHLKKHDTIIWGHINLIPLLFFIYPFIFKKRNILIIHGIDVWNPLFKTIFKSWAVKKMNEVWSVSNYTKKRFVENYSFPFEKVHIFSNTIMPKPIQNTNPYKGDSIKLLSILRLQNKEKALSVLRVLDVMPELLKKHPVEFYIIGDGNYKSQILKYIKEKQLTSNVHLLGYINNTAPYLQHCDIFTLVSDTEGFGIVLLEAMQFAKPCIAAKNTGSEDVIKDGESGFLVNPDDAFELTQKLLLLIENKHLRMQLGEKGKQIFETNFTFEHFCEKQKQLLLY